MPIIECAKLVVREYLTFWKKARIPIRAAPDCGKVLVNLHKTYRELQKNCKKDPEFHRHREKKFSLISDNLFDISLIERIANHFSNPKNKY